MSKRNSLILLIITGLLILSSCSFKSTRSVNINVNGENIVDAKAGFDTEDPNLFSFDVNTSEYARTNFGSQNGEPLSWFIVDDDDDYQLLFSEKVIDVVLFDQKESVKDFTESSLCDYLNSDFVNITFSNDEKEKLAFINDTDEYQVTLPSLNNLLDLYGKMNYIKDGYYNDADFFEANTKIIAKPTEIAINNDIDPFDNNTFAEIIQQDVDARYDFANGHVPYWVLNVDEKTGFPHYITSTGYVGLIEANTPYIGIRPIVRIKK